MIIIKKYDKLFNKNKEQIEYLYLVENKSIEEISKIIGMPRESLRLRLRRIIKLRKKRYFVCPICKKDVVSFSFKRHMIRHWYNIKNDIHCKWCDSQNVVKHGFTKLNNEQKQNILCRDCNKITVLGATGSRQKKRTREFCDFAFKLKKLGFTYKKIVEFFKQTYGISIDEKTAWWWELYGRSSESLKLLMAQQKTDGSVTSGS